MTVRRILALAAILIPAVALADITGPARVIDGDTLEIGGERIRLHGIDAPERGQTCLLQGRVALELKRSGSSDEEAGRRSIAVVTGKEPSPDERLLDMTYFQP